MTIRSMKKQRAELVALVAECERVWALANGAADSYAESRAMEAVVDARHALTDFDTRDFEYVAAGIASARRRLDMALSLLGL